MADFEGLINQALAKQNATDPAARERVYQSSRNALVKMLEKAGNLPDDAVRAHFGKLEDSIARIEARYQPPVEDPPGPARDVVPAETSPAPRTVTQTVTRTVAQTAAPQTEAVGPEPEPDIIDELEALIPSTYQAKPMFPPVTTPAPITPPTAMLPNAGYQQPEPQPVQSGHTVRTEPQVSRLETRFEPQPEIQAEIRPESRKTWQADTVDRPAARRPEEPVFEDDYRGLEKVVPYLGDVTEEATRSGAFDEFDVEREPARVYQRKNPLLRRIWPIFLAIAVVLVVLWILYALLANMPAEQASGNNGVVLGPVGESRIAEDGSVFITLLEPTDLSALVTAGRGTAELITEQKQQVLRLKSVRQGALKATGAEPILLELEKGVLNQISGKVVTVELYAKSGQNGPAQFAVECDFAGDSICGRKRFRVGTQPERIVFALDLSAGIQPGERAYLAINTDITNAADASGSGDAIDVIYARLRLPDA